MGRSRSDSAENSLPVFLYYRPSLRGGGEKKKKKKRKGNKETRMIQVARESTAFELLLSLHLTRGRKKEGKKGRKTGWAPFLFAPGGKAA